LPIFESIQKAETSAEQKRLEAQAQANALLEQNRLTIENAILQLNADADAKIRAIEADAEKLASSEAVRIVAEGAEADRIAARRAATRTDRALKAVLKKVTGA